MRHGLHVWRASRTTRVRGHDSLHRYVRYTYPMRHHCATHASNHRCFSPFIPSHTPSLIQFPTPIGILTTSKQAFDNNIHRLSRGPQPISDSSLLPHLPSVYVSMLMVHCSPTCAVTRIRRSRTPKAVGRVDAPICNGLVWSSDLCLGLVSRLVYYSYYCIMIYFNLGCYIFS